MSGLPTKTKTRRPKRGWFRRHKSDIAVGVVETGGDIVGGIAEFGGAVAELGGSVIEGGAEAMGGCFEGCAAIGAVVIALPAIGIWLAFGAPSPF